MSVLNKFIKQKETTTQLWLNTILDCVIDLTWSKDGNLLAVGAANGPITFFDKRTGEKQIELIGHKFGTMSMDWSNENNSFASSGQDGYIKLWDLMHKEPRFILPGGSSWVEHLAWSPEGNFLISTAGRNLLLWDCDGQLLGEYPDHLSTITDVAWRPITKTTPDLMFATSCYGSVQFWKPENTTLVKHFEWKGSILKLAWSPNAKFLATGDQDSTVHFWVVETGTELQMWGYLTKVRELSWDVTSRYLATGGGTEVTIWDCSGNGPENSKPIILKLHEGLLSQLAYQHRGSLLASAGEDGILAIWQPEYSKKKPLIKKQYPTPIEKISWSPNDKFLAVGGADGLVEVISINI